MKAKEYADRIIEARYSMKSVISVADDIAREAETLCRARRCGSQSAFDTVVREQYDKWNAICRIVNDHAGADALRQDGLEVLWKKKLALAMVDLLEEDMRNRPGEK